MDTFDLPESSGLNALLEDERASVEIEVALVRGATDLSERDTLANMGAQEVGFCVALRERLEQSGGPVSPRVNGVVLDLLNIEHYDERLSAFADHQLRIAEALPALRGNAPDGDLRALLGDIEDAHLRSAAWCRRRASAFAATRLLVFRGAADGSYPDAQGSSTATNGSYAPPIE
jgi:hypothetical protein